MKATQFLLAALCSIPSAASAGVPDAAAYIAARGWTPYKQHKPLRMPVRDIVPVMYIAKGDTVPSCGLLFQGKGASVFIDVLGPEEAGGFPQCLSIDDAAAFELDKKQYLVFEIVNRDTRDDTYRQFFYVYKDGAGQYLKDVTLQDATDPGFRGKTKGAAEGVKLAKAALIRKLAPGMALLGRDSIYSETGTYAVLEDKRGARCAFVFEKAGSIFKFDHAAFSGADKCTDILATSKFDKNGKTYFMTMFKGLKQKRLAIVSISKSNVIVPEKELAALAGAKASLTDMRSVRMFILSTMQ